MAVLRKKGGKETPPISTASLPDVIFMILFFFMISTTFREQDVLVKVEYPSASEVQKLERKNLVSYIYVGPPQESYQAVFGTAPRIQLNDSFRTTQDILEFIASERDNLGEMDRAAMTVSIKGDKNVRMGIITDIKQELRRANSLKISYNAFVGLGYE